MVAIVPVKFQVVAATTCPWACLHVFSVLNTPFFEELYKRVL
jgi:hypothetical protein